MNILGISAYYHDSAACLVRSGRVVAAAEEERFTRRKYDPAFPAEAVKYCLTLLGPEEEIDAVAFHGHLGLKRERALLNAVKFGTDAVDSL